MTPLKQAENDITSIYLFTTLELEKMWLPKPLRKLLSYPISIEQFFHGGYVNNDPCIVMLP